MAGLRMDGIAKMETHLTSAAAFVEGGVQESCDDACSICLEPFCETDPSTVTGCKHEYHLQCILEWCQRSSQCPMCWQPISLKDPISQELLEAVEQERSIRSNQTRNTAIFHHPTLGDFELQHLPVGASDSELEERIIQHLAAAAAMGRAHHIARREGRGRSGTQGRQQFLVFSTHPNAVSNGAASANSSHRDGEAVSAAFAASPSSPPTATGEEILHQIQQVNPAQAEQVAVSPSGVRIPATDTPVNSSNRIPTGQSTPLTQDRAGSSDFQSFSDSLKSRLNAVSMRYKESITKSTRGWKEKLFARSNSVSDIGSEVRREVNAGIATVSRMMERLDSRDSRRTSGTSSPQNTECHPVTEPSNERAVTQTLPNGSNTPASCATVSGEN